MSKLKFRLYILTVFFVVAVLLVSFLCFNGFSYVPASAAVIASLDTSDVMDDLNTATINGKPFNLVDYPFDNTGLLSEPEIITMVEYCYSNRPAQREKYGLYLYFYNPQAIDFDTDSSANKVLFGVDYSVNSQGNIEVSDYEKFDLQFCSKSTGDYYNLFYKFKIVDHIGDDGKTIAERVNSNARRYDISEVELLVKGDKNSTAYSVGSSYIYTGYAKGYGPDISADSTLTYECKNLATVSLDLSGVTDGVDKRTFWRSDSSSKGKNHQNQINSVFFAIDTDLLEEYGYTLQKIKAEWWEYKTAPALVVASDTVRAKLFEYAGENIGETYDISRGYSVYNVESELTTLFPFGSQKLYYYSYCWNVNKDYIDSGGSDGRRGFSYNLDNFLYSLPLIFSSGGISVDEYTLSANTLQSYCEEYNKSYNNGHLQFNGHDFSSDLFLNEVDDGRTRGYNLREFDISDSDDLWQINSYDSNHSWWDKLWDYGFYAPTTDDDYSDVLPIQMLRSEDFAVSNIADHLKINSNDVSKLKDYFNASVKDNNNDGKPDNSVFLFRYALTDYWAQDVVVTTAGNIDTFDHNAELRQGTQFFDFDILTLTFCKDGDLTVLGVSSSPVDHWSSFTPSVEGKQPEWLKWLKIVLLIIVAIIVLILLWPILSPVLSAIIKGLIWLITAPFKALSKLFKRKKEQKKE